jgi:hypothetical protein
MPMRSTLRSFDICDPTHSGQQSNIFLHYDDDESVALDDRLMIQLRELNE